MVLLRTINHGDGTETRTWRHARPWKTDLRLFMRLRALVQ